MDAIPIPQEAKLVQHGARMIEAWTNDANIHTKYDTIEGGTIAVITMSRPEARNAWTEHMRNEVARSLDMASRDPVVRATIITGDPKGKAFCAGADLGIPSEEAPHSMQGDVPDGRSDDLPWWRDGGGVTALAVMRSTKPVIAAINGAAVGVGMTLPLCCDITIASAEAKVGFVFGKRGLTMECCSSYFLERCVGHKKAMELVLTGRIFSTKDAPNGLFNYVVPGAEVMPKAIEIAKEICGTSAMSSMLNRTMIIRNSNMSVEQAHLSESQNIKFCIGGKDVAEGVTSFMEKRAPKFAMDPFKDAPPHYPWWQEIATRSKL